MNDREYEEFLVALSRKHLRMDELASHSQNLREDVGELMATSRLLHAVHERAENDDKPFGEPDRLPVVNVYQTLGSEIAKLAKAPAASPPPPASGLHAPPRPPAHAPDVPAPPAAPALRLIDALRAIGVLDALDDTPELVLTNLRRSAIPSEDLDMLRRSGIEDPEAEVTILVHKARALPPLADERPSEALERALNRLEQIGQKMQAPPEDATPPKRRKILNGVGKVLGGFVTLGGNTLLVTGTILAPNPATGYAGIASAGLGLTGVLTGLGDLRGE